MNIKRIKDFKEYTSFINSFINDSEFSDPHLLMKLEKGKDINDWAKNPENICICIENNDKVLGLFVFYTIPEENYLEMMMGLSRDPEAVKEFVEYLVDNYKGYQADCVFNPRWSIFKKELEKHSAIFDIEQQRMVYNHKTIDIDTSEIQPYTETYREQYIEIHTGDRYWTAEKTIEAKDRFNIFLAINDNKVVGYIDVSNCFDENEPYDLYVKPEYRGKGFGKKLLIKALQTNEPKEMMLLVDIDNPIAIKLYESVGFVKKDRFNMLTAKLLINN